VRHDRALRGRRLAGRIVTNLVIISAARGGHANVFWDIALRAFGLLLAPWPWPGWRRSTRRIPSGTAKTTWALDERAQTGRPGASYAS
jgi:hypothetical protein